MSVESSQVHARARAEDYPLVMDVPLVAEMLLTDANQVRKWANAGLIPCHRVPGTRKYRFLRDEILGWLQQLPGQSPEEAIEEAARTQSI
jgi:excisionase family DNA binding protein